ncbi:MAG: phage holin family protein [Chloroflexota bacterium]
MVKLIIRLVINAIALWLAATLISGIELSSNLWEVLIVAIIFGLINALIKPVIKLISLPLIAVTLGLFTLVINAFLLLLTSWLSSALTVDGLIPAFLGAIVISLVSWLLSLFVDDD